MEKLDSGRSRVYDFPMAESNPHSGYNAASRPMRRHNASTPPQQANRGRVLLGALIGVGAVAAIVLADGEWEWRDSLRRLAHGEEIPAFRANAWSDARAVREKLADRLLTSDLSPVLEERSTRRDLALYTLVVAAGDSTVSMGGRGLGVLMEELCLDVEWLEEMVYFAPLAHAEKALPILAHIYRAEKKKMAGSPANRRLAAAVAFEFARADLTKEEALKGYLFYAASGQKHWLNGRFSELSFWEMSVLAARLTDRTWGNEETLAWFQRNNRLPSWGYASLGKTLGKQPRGLFGESVDSGDFHALYRDAADGSTASLYEASGCSTERDRAYYAATAACANGVPALVAEGGQTACCLVDVNGSWELSAPLEDGMKCSWSYLGQEHPDFVRLASLLGSEMEKTLAASRLACMGQYLYGTGNTPLAHSFFREAVKTQPLNYAAWAGYRAAGAPEEEMAEGLKHFEQLPGVAASLRSQEAQ